MRGSQRDEQFDLFKSFSIGHLRDFVVNNVAANHLQLARLCHFQNAQDGLRFETQTILRLVVEGAIQTTYIEIDFHRSVGRMSNQTLPIKKNVIRSSFGGCQGGRVRLTMLAHADIHLKRKGQVQDMTPQSLKVKIARNEIDTILMVF